MNYLYYSVINYVCIEAQENAENFTSELDQVKITLKQTEEEKSRLEEELTRVKYKIIITIVFIFTSQYFIVFIVGKKYIEKRNYKSRFRNQQRSNHHQRVQTSK